MWVEPHGKLALQSQETTTQVTDSQVLRTRQCRLDKAATHTETAELVPDVRPVDDVRGLRDGVTEDERVVLLIACHCHQRVSSVQHSHECRM